MLRLLALAGLLVLLPATTLAADEGAKDLAPSQAEIKKLCEKGCVVVPTDAFDRIIAALKACADGQPTLSSPPNHP